MNDIVSSLHYKYSIKCVCVCCRSEDTLVGLVICGFQALNSGCHGKTASVFTLCAILPANITSIDYLNHVAVPRQWLSSPSFYRWRAEVNRAQKYCQCVRGRSGRTRIQTLIVCPGNSSLTNRQDTILSLSHPAVYRSVPVSLNLEGIAPYPVALIIF